MEKLRIAYIPQVPMQPFTFEVASVEEAARIADALVKFSAFEYEHRVKPDYSDALDLEAFMDGEWVTWYSLDGEDFDDYREAHGL